MKEKIIDMAKGAVAKDYLINKFIKDNPDIYIGCYDKKYYFWSQENGENIQIAISLTCPKNPVESSQAVAVSWDKVPNMSNGIDFEAMSKPQEPVVITADEKQNVLDLMERLGL